MNLAEREQKRVVDLVRLQPTKNAELQDQWGLDSGSEIHQYLESELKDYYYRDDDGYIWASDTGEVFAQNHHDVIQPEDEPEEAPDLRRRDLVIALVTLTQEVGHLPSQEEVNTHGEYRHHRYREEFGDLFNAFQAAGILPDDVTRADFYGDEERGSEAEDEMESEELEPEPDLVEGTAEPTEPNEVGDKVETEEAPEKIYLAETDVERLDFEVPDDIDESDLIEQIQRFAGIIDEPPTEELVTAYGRYPEDKYRAVFGSWDAALEITGHDPDDMPDWSGRSHTNVDILDGLRAVAAEIGHAPTTTKTGKHVDFSPGLASLRFGSWRTALETAGLDPSERPSVQDRESDDSEDQEADDRDTTDDDGGVHDDPIGSVIDQTLEDMLLSDDDDGSA